MYTRRHLLRLVPPFLVVAAAGGCRSASTIGNSGGQEGDSDGEPSDTDRVGANETDSAHEVDSDVATPENCVATDDDIQGPFYRANAPERGNLAISADGGTALHLSGRVLHSDGCSPIGGAVVDLWQADPEGVYDNASSEMRYRGRVITDTLGQWEFQTTEPGRYMNGSRYRPAHLHVKIWVEGALRLTSQLYFPGDPFNDTDNWYNPALEVERTGDGAARFDFVVA